MRNDEHLSVNKNLLVAFALAALVALNACAPQNTAPAQPAATAVTVRATATAVPTAMPTAAPTTPKEIARLNEAALKNGAYELRDIGKLQLSEGKYEKAYGSGATQVDCVTFMIAAYGDLNGDKVEDAAVILAAQTGGSGSFYSLVPVTNDNGAPKQVGVDYLGDRIKLESIKIEQGQIVVNMLVAGPKDPLCCPSQKVTRTYAMRSGSLVLLSETVVAPTTAATAAQALSAKDATYRVEGTTIPLVKGVSEIEAAPGSASKITTRYFGNDALGDLNGDGKEDVAFLLTQNRGGSGTFFYVVAALRTETGYLGTNAVLLGDRIAPQTTSIENGVVIVNYADRKPGESFTTAPSVGVSKYLKITDLKLVEVSGIR